ncbi:unnamed protein product [Closterium sp. NIES-54]
MQTQPAPPQTLQTCLPAALVPRQHHLPRHPLPPPYPTSRAALPCPACRTALLAARRPSLPARRPAGRASSCPARVPPCRLPRRPAALPCPTRAPPCWPPRRPTLPARRSAGRRATLPCPRTALLAVAPPCPARARFSSARALPFPSRCPVACFDTWLDDLQLYLLSNSRNNVSLFDHTTGASLAPPDTADSATRSQWLTHDAAAHLAICNHVPLAERAEPTLASIRLLKLFEDLITHLRTSDTRYCAALEAEFLDKNPPPMYITLYFIVTRLPDSLCAVRDHFLALDPTDLTVDLLEKHLLADETSIVAVGAACGTPRTPFLEGCSPSPLAPFYPVLQLLTSLVLRRSGLLLLLVGSAVAVGVVVVEAVEVAEVAVGVVAGVGAWVAAVVAAVGVVVAVVAAMGVVAATVVAVGVELFRGEVLAVARGSSSSVQARPLRPSSFRCGKFHTQHCCFSRLNVAWRAEFGDEAERPRWLELLRSGVDIFALDYDAILAAMYALIVSAEGDCYLCVPPDLGIEAAALGASESALPGPAPAASF